MLALRARSPCLLCEGCFKILFSIKTITFRNYFYCNFLNITIASLIKINSNSTKNNNSY